MKKSICILFAAVLILSLCGCGRSASGFPTEMSAPAEAPAPAAAFYADSTQASAYAEEAADYGFAMNGSAVAAKGEAEEDVPQENPEKIIYSANVTVETTDFEGSLGKLEDLLASCGGWVESSSVNGANFYQKSRGYADTRSASYTLRIPSDRFDEVMNDLSGLGNVPFIHTYTENVSAQYYDTEAHLKAYQTQETRLLEMMEKAETVEDIVILEDRLTELRWRIESLQSSLNNWDRRVSYSSVYLDLQEVREYTPESETRLSYGQRLWRSLKDGVKAVAEFFEELLLWLVGALPTLLILAVLVLLLRLPVKKALARRKEKKLAKKAAKSETAKSEGKAE